MDLTFDIRLAEHYHSNAQRTRVMSEAWMAHNMFCPCCGHYKLTQFENNRPVADFYCENCGEIFELKSKKGALGKKIADGAYLTAVQRIESNQNPSLFVLQYQSLTVTDLTLVPKFFFTPSVLQKRSPLPPTARRAGWVGSNILYSEIPTRGKIPVIQNGHPLDKEQVIADCKQLQSWYVEDISNRGWLFDVLQCVDAIPKSEFTLADMYQFTEKLAQKHPDNHNVRPKIRQKLQVLRDKGYIIFLGNGHYLKV